MPDHHATVMLEKYYAVWAMLNADAVAAFFTPDAVFEDLALSARFEGVQGVSDFARLTFGAIPDFAIEPEHILASGDRAAASWIMRGTHAGDLPGAPATGRAFEIRASSIITLRDQKILRMVDYWNPLALVTTPEAG